MPLHPWGLSRFRPGSGVAAACPGVPGGEGGPESEGEPGLAPKTGADTRVPGSLALTDDGLPGAGTEPTADQKREVMTLDRSETSQAARGAIDAAAPEPGAEIRALGYPQGFGERNQGIGGAASVWPGVLAGAGAALVLILLRHRRNGREEPVGRAA